MDSSSIYSDTKTTMDSSMASLRKKLGQVRTGRASLSVLEPVRVDYYGQPTPLNQVATLAVPDPKLITIQPWEKNIIGNIEKAILKADLGLTPVNDGKIIRLPIPDLSEERRHGLVKQIKHTGEEYRVSIRNERREAMNNLKQLHKDHAIAEDDLEREKERIQKLHDEHIKKIDEMVSEKEKELLKI